MQKKYSIADIAQIDLYRRFGFHTIRVLDGNSTLRQYCMVR